MQVNVTSQKQGIPESEPTCKVSHDVIFDICLTIKLSITDEFYSLFYLGLYCEIRGETSKARTYMRAAEDSKYATGPGNGDYMTSCARVHCKLRGWT